LAPATLGIYFLHPLVQGVLQKLEFHGLLLPVGLGVPILTILIFVLSSGLTIAMMRVPVLNWIAGSRVGGRR